MKKNILIIISIIGVLFLSTFAYFYIWGDKPNIETFEHISEDYEIIAQLTLGSYNKLKPYDSYPENELIVVNIKDDTLECNNYYLDLTDEQKKAVLTVGENFNYIAVYEEAVFFHVDETGYYGLVYTEHPVTKLYKSKLPQQGREYHRINSHWYEWGVWWRYTNLLLCDGQDRPLHYQVTNPKFLFFKKLLCKNTWQNEYNLI